MAGLKRQSPVRFKSNPFKTEVRENWTVALAYDGEGDGPWIVDLSHKTRWDLQDKQIAALTIGELAVPETPGCCTFADNTLINRMNRTQASIYHLGSEAPALPDFPGYTDVTESTLLIALLGPKAFRVTEKLTNLDVANPDQKTPFLLQGPFCHVPCQIVTLQKNARGDGGILLTCSRGYGESLICAIQEAGAEFGLRPAGENRFAEWIQGL